MFEDMNARAELALKNKKAKEATKTKENPPTSPVPAFKRTKSIATGSYDAKSKPSIVKMFTNSTRVLKGRSLKGRSQAMLNSLDEEQEDGLSQNEQPERATAPPNMVRLGSQVDMSPGVIVAYRCLEVLTHRESATLERCIRTADEREVAVKAFNIIALKGKSRRTLSRVKKKSPWEKLQVEVAIMKKIDHPHVVETIDTITDDERGYLFIILEWINGTATMDYDEKAGRYFSSQAQQDTILNSDPNSDPKSNPHL